MSYDREIPTSLRDCYQVDTVSSGLWDWSSDVKSIGKIILAIICIAGLVVTISSAIQASDIDEDTVAITVIASLFTWGLYAFFEYVAYNCISLLLASLASIVQNTRITAKIALYNAAKDEGLLDKISAGEPSATSQNSGYSLSAMAYKREQNNDFWICKECGSKNHPRNLNCKDCGTYK